MRQHSRVDCVEPMLGCEAPVQPLLPAEIALSNCSHTSKVSKWHQLRKVCTDPEASRDAPASATVRVKLTSLTCSVQSFICCEQTTSGVLNPTISLRGPTHTPIAASGASLMKQAASWSRSLSQSGWHAPSGTGVQRPKGLSIMDRTECETHGHGAFEGV